MAFFFALVYSTLCQCKIQICHNISKDMTFPKWFLTWVRRPWFNVNLFCKCFFFLIWRLGTLSMIQKKFNLKCFDYEGNHEANCKAVAVVPASSYKSKWKLNKMYQCIIWSTLNWFRTCWRSFAGDAVRMKLEMYTLTNVAIRNWQSNRSMIPPWPGIISPKSCKKCCMNKFISDW